MLALVVALVAASCGGDGRDRSVGVATLVGTESPATDVAAAAEGTAAAAGPLSDEQSIPTAPAPGVDASAGSSGAEASGTEAWGAQPSGTEAPPQSVLSDDASQNNPPSGIAGQDDPAADDPADQGSADDDPAHQDSDDDPADDGSADEDSAEEELSDEDMALDFAACVRENGLPDFADPTVDADGNVRIDRMFAGSGVQLNSEEFRQAFSACRRHIEGATFGQAGGGFNLTETQDTLLGFARCLRSEGIEVDDPELSKLVTGSEEDVPRRLFGEAFDVTDPAVQDAVEACVGELGGLAGAGAGG